MPQIIDARPAAMQPGGSDAATPASASATSASGSATVAGSATSASGPASAPGGKAWESVLRTIEAQLLDGTLAPGDHLPPERALASALGVGRSSVREAVRVLEVLGLVRTATGSGPGAGAIIVATPRGGMSALLRLQTAAQGFPVADIVRTRLLLETEVAGDLAERAGARPAVHSPENAAQRPSTQQISANLRPEPATSGPQRTDAHPAVHSSKSAAQTPSEQQISANLRPTAAPQPALADARQLLAAMEPAALTPAEFLALDARFHVALAEASGNTVVTAMMTGLRDAIESYVLTGVADLPDWQRTVARLRREHRGILTAIETGDAVGARRRIHDHITGYYSEMSRAPAG